MICLKIQIGIRQGDSWPVEALYTPTNGKEVRHCTQLRLSNLQANLAEVMDKPFSSPPSLEQCIVAMSGLDPLRYGTVLGRALFFEELRDDLLTTRHEEGVRVLLFIEAKDLLRTLHWEQLASPVEGQPGKWGFLARDQHSPLTLHIPSGVTRRFVPVKRDALRALVVIASPAGLSNRYGLVEFDVAKAAAELRKTFADANIPCDLLADVADAVGPPSLDELCARLTSGSYSLLHVIAHGKLSSDAEREPCLFLQRSPEKMLAGGDAVARQPAGEIVKRLQNLGDGCLPRVTFLSACESASPQAEAAEARGGLAQRLILDVGLPAVLAMTGPVTLATSLDVAAIFYKKLREHGEPDLALTEACAGLADRADVLVPALFGREASCSIFAEADAEEHLAAEKELQRFSKLTSEVRGGINRLQWLKAIHDKIQGLQPIIDELEGELGTLEALAGRPWPSGKKRLIADLEDSLEDLLRSTDPAQGTGAGDASEGKADPQLDAMCSQVKDAQVDLADAQGRSDVGALQSALSRVARILNSDAAVINGRLVEVASNLDPKLDTLFKSFDTVKAALQRGEVAAETAEQFEAKVRPLKTLWQPTDELIKVHDKWQALDGELRVTEVRRDVLASVLRRGWPRLRDKLNQLIALPANATKRSKLEAAAGDIDKALAGTDQSAIVDAWNAFWSVAFKAFCGVDKNLLAQCNELRRAGDVLDAIFSFYAKLEIGKK